MPKNISVRKNSVYPDRMTTQTKAIPNMYTVSPGHSLLSVLADHLLFEQTFANKLELDRSDLSDLTLLLPTKRAVKAMRDSFLARSEGAACILPRMHALGDIDEADLALESFSILGSDQFLLPPTISPLLRRLVMARHVTEIYPEVFGGDTISKAEINPSAALSIATDLLKIIDSAEIEQASLSELSSVVADQFAENWQQTLAFLKLITHSYPEEVKAMGLMEPMAKRNKLLSLYGQKIKHGNTEGRIIAAGSTGSTPATRDLLAVIASLPEGAVILPGLDKHLDEETWQKLSDDHPQNAMKGLLDKMSIKRSGVNELGPTQNKVDHTREKLMSEVMRPAEDTDRWHHTLRQFDSNVIEKALAPVKLMTASSQREEALAIALQLRSVLEKPGKTAALVTPDRGLANRVLNEMKRWGVEINDSAGQKLSSSAKAKILILIANCLRENFSPISLLSLLRHPHVLAGLSSEDCSVATNLLEICILRGPRPSLGLEGIKTALSKVAKEEHRKFISTLLSALECSFAPLLAYQVDKKIEIHNLAFALLQTYENLLTGEDEILSQHVWSGEDGEALALLFSELLEQKNFLPTIGIGDFREYLETIIEDRILHQNQSAHPRLYIYGLLEARLVSCDLIILGGMNEGVWPQTTSVDPWLNRPMRKKLDMPAPERRIGLSAHDFVQNFCANDVIITRSEKIDGVPTVPSRWILRLKAVLEAVGAKDYLLEGNEYLAWTRLMDMSQLVKPATPPRPAPPVSVRPRMLSVTQIEVWQRDPYAIYARHILGLQKLPDIDADPGYAEKGTLIHKIMERYTLELTGQDDPLKKLQNIGEEEFANWGDRPSVIAFWQPRFERIAKWYVPEDMKLRKDVSKQYAEVRGEAIIKTGGEDFVLRGVADRIDVLKDGTLRILDYKTGQIPGKKEVGVFASQMPLEAYIAMSGGFANIATSDVSQMVYVKLSGAKPPGDFREAAENTFPGDCREEIRELVSVTIEGLKKRITHFDTEETPYLTRIKPKNENTELDYDHLSRYREWSVLQSWEERSK